MSEDRHIRGDNIYVSWQARMGLIYSAMKRGEMTSADQLADDIILEWLNKHEPVIVQHMEKRTNEEQAFKKSLKPKIPLG